MSATHSGGGQDRGKWSVSGVPHKGWICIGIDDLEDRVETCEMCETQYIRYVHYMEHLNYLDVLGVGSVCAAHMEEDYEAPNQREMQAKSLADRRSRWMSGRWRQSHRGNPYINRNGFHVVLYPRRGRWAFRIERRDTVKAWYGTGYATLDDAKLAAFGRYEALRR